MAGEKLELTKMRADSFGKIKTFAQMTGISCLIASPMFGSFFFDFSSSISIIHVISSKIYRLAKFHVDLIALTLFVNSDDSLDQN